MLRHSIGCYLWSQPTRIVRGMPGPIFEDSNVPHPQCCVLWPLSLSPQAASLKGIPGGRATTGLMVWQRVGKDGE